MIPQAHYYMTAPEFESVREERLRLVVAQLSVIKFSLVDQIIQITLLKVILGLKEIFNSLFLTANYFTVFVVHTGHFQKIQSRKVFKSGTPSEFSYIS